METKNILNERRMVKSTWNCCCIFLWRRWWKSNKNYFLQLPVLCVLSSSSLPLRTWTMSDDYVGEFLEIKIYDFYFFLLARFTTGQCLKGQFTPFSCAFIEHREWVVEMRCVRFHNLELDNPFWWYEKSIETQYEAWVVEKMSEFSSLISLRDSFMSDKADSDEWKRIFLESSAHLRTRVRARAWKIVNPRGFTTNDETRKKNFSR